MNPSLLLAIIRLGQRIWALSPSACLVPTAQLAHGGLKEDLLAMKDTARSGGFFYVKAQLGWFLCLHMDCLFVLHVFLLLDLALVCSVAVAKNTKRIQEWIVLADTTCVTCAARQLQEEHLDGRGTLVKAAWSSTNTWLARIAFVCHLVGTRSWTRLAFQSTQVKRLR